MKNMNYPPHQVEKVRWKKWVQNVENVLFSLNIYTETQGREASWFLMNSCVNKKHEYVTRLKREAAVQKLSQSEKKHTNQTKSPKKWNQSQTILSISAAKQSRKKRKTYAKRKWRVEYNDVSHYARSSIIYPRKKEANTKAEKVQKK